MKFYYNAFTLLWNAGLRDSFFSAKNKYPTYELWVTGFSMGGSLAALAAPYISQLGYFDKNDIKLVAFGEMRVGHADFANRMSDLVPYSYRVYHNKDMSAHIIPTSAGYVHHKNEIWYPNKMEFGDPYVECDAQESPNCTNSVPSNLWTWDDHLNTFVVGIDAYRYCKKGPIPTYKLNVSYESGNFFDNFDFINHSTTGNTSYGFVDWVNRTIAEELGIMEYKNGQVIIGVDHTNIVPQNSTGRAALRLYGKTTFNDGALFILDAEQIPNVKGTRMAFWTFGPTWPNDGEIDILEGWYNKGADMITLHTGPNCQMGPVLNESGFLDLWTGKWRYREHDEGYLVYCNSTERDNAGCGYNAQYGTISPQFNEGGGGLYIAEWDKNNYIKIWIMKRNEIPKDIIQGTPNPDSWGRPIAFYRIGSQCTPDHFNYQKIVLDVTFCTPDIPYEGGIDACIDYVRNNPQDFVNASWVINSLKVYTRLTYFFLENYL